MTKFAYPEEINKQNIKSLTKRASQIKQKAMLSIYSTSLIFSLIAMLSTFGLLYTIPYLPGAFNVTSEIEASGLIIGFVILYIEFLVFVLFDLIEMNITKILKLSYRECVLSSCILIADSLYSKNLYSARSETNMFVTSLLGFKRTTGKEFKSEINTLSNGKKSFRRMITFSEIGIPELLLRFGTCIETKDDPLAYLFLEALIKEAKHYGEMDGLLRRVERFLTSYKGLTALIISVITIVIALIGKGIL